MAKELVSCGCSLKGHWLTCKNAGSLNICYKFLSLVNCFWISFPLENPRMSFAWVYHSQLISFPWDVRNEALQHPLWVIGQEAGSLSSSFAYTLHPLKRAKTAFLSLRPRSIRIRKDLRKPSKRVKNHAGLPATENFAGTQNFQCWNWVS